ncbi:MAG TPA: Ig domain-containing protein [Terriglobia bacterium]|nr:Ig domain-containing protein [Terriglobia bacterium]
MKRAVAWIALAIIVSGCGGGHTAPQPTFQVSIFLSPSSQQGIDQGQSISFTASVANDSNNQGVTWSLSGNGCSGSACGALTNTTTTAARYNAPASVSSAFTVSVKATSVKDPGVYASTAVLVSPIPVVATTSLREGTPGAAYSDTLQASGGSGSLSWSIVAGSLPAGLSLDAATGVISGAPAAGGTSTFTVQVTDSAPTPLSASSQLSLTIVSRNLTIATASLPDGTEGVAYSATLQEQYGTLPVSWSVTAGSLPPGLTLDAPSGLVSGTPTATGTSTFTVTVADSSSPAQNGSRQLSITVNPGGADNTLLDGHYAFLLSGYDSTGQPLAVAGSFFADGSGGVQNGVEDINSYAANAAATLATFTGAYAVGADRRGTITITNSQNATFTLAMAMGAVSSGVAAKGSILEFDQSGYTMSGVIDQQDTAAFSQAALNGGYAFSFTGFDSVISRLGMAGKFSAAGSGGITAGLFDANDNGSLTAGATFTGAYAAVDTANGRTQVTLASVSPAPALYAFYAVSASRWLAVSLDNSATSGLLIGQVEAQSGGPYASSSLNGTAVVSMESSSGGASGGSHVALGLATFDGSGNVSFSLDDNDAGTLSTLSPSGTYAVTDAAAGRFTVSPQGMSQMVGYLISANQGFILGTGADVATGVIEPQSTGPFDAASLNTTVFFGSEPFAAPPAAPPLGGSSGSLSVGVMTFDGGGNLSGTSDSNQLGTLDSAQAISDTYAVSANGRVTVGLNSQVLYIVSPAKILSMSTGAKAPNPTLGFGQQ